MAIPSRFRRGLWGALLRDRRWGKGSAAVSRSRASRSANVAGKTPLVTSRTIGGWTSRNPSRSDSANSRNAVQPGGVPVHGDRPRLSVTPVDAPRKCTAVDRTAYNAASKPIARGSLPRHAMHWIAPPEKDTTTATLEKRLWERAGRASSGSSHCHWRATTASMRVSWLASGGSSEYT